MMKKDHFKQKLLLWPQVFLTLNRFYSLFWYFHCWFETSKCRLGCLYQMRTKETLFDKFSELLKIRSWKGGQWYHNTKKMIFWKKGINCGTGHRIDKSRGWGRGKYQLRARSKYLRKAFKKLRRYFWTYY